MGWHQNKFMFQKTILGSDEIDKKNTIKIMIKSHR